MAILVLPLGPVEKGVVKGLARDLGNIFKREFAEGSALAEPEYAINRERGQFNSSAILHDLTERPELMGFERVLGVVDRDLFTSGLNFVFGEAGTKAAVIALARLKEGFYGRPEDKMLLRKRALVEAVHELGHTYGLGHCADERCVMFFSKTLSDTDRKGHGFRGRCFARAMDLGLLTGR